MKGNLRGTLQLVRSLGERHMKIVNYVYRGEENYGVLVGDKIIPHRWIEAATHEKLPGTIMEFIFQGKTFEVMRHYSKLEEYCGKGIVSLSNVKVVQPVPMPRKIICLGLNYWDHAEEVGLKPPSEPVIFFKPWTSITGPYNPIIYPRITRELDYEGELAVIIGRKAKYVSEREAVENVLGYMVFNDVTARDIQFRDRQWTRGKSFDTFAPTGPFIVTRDEIDDPHSLRIVTKVNEEIRQDSSTSNMVLTIEKVISSLSNVMTLEPGDIIATGTPSGVGIFFKPKPRLLKLGDVVKVWIEGVGEIENKIIREKSWRNNH